jgi:beta-lactam-binding protein with PASTA domain
MEQILKLVFLALVVLFYGVPNASGQSTQKKFAMPNITGLPFAEAIKVLRSKKLEFGAMLYQSETEIPDSLIVYKQNPPAKSAKGIQTKIRKGDIVDIWLVNPRIMSDTLTETKRRTTADINDFQQD